MQLRSATKAAGVLLALSLAGIPACQDPAERVEEHRSRGDAALAEGRHDDAIIEYKNLLQIEPNDAAAHYGLARSYLGVRQGRQAFWELQETVRLAPDHFDARLQYAQLLMAGSQENREQALEQIEAVLEADEARWIAWLLKGQALYSLGRHDEARLALQTCLEHGPEESAALFGLAEFHRTQGERDRAEPLYRKLAELEASAPAWQALARFLADDREREADAEAAYRKALELAEPAERTKAHRQLASFFFARERLDEAETVLRQGIETEEDDFELLYTLAQLYAARGDPDGADALLLEAVEARPGDARLLLAVSDYRELRGDLAGAIEAAEQAVAANPDDQRTKLRRAELLLTHGFGQRDAERIAKGRAALNAVLAREPDLPEALYVRSRVHISEQDYEQAVATLRRVLDRRPAWARAHMMLGNALALLGDRFGARSELARALELDPGMVAAQRGLARLHAELGDDEAAVELGRRALRSAPHDTELHLSVSQSLVRLGRADEATDQLERIPASQRNAETWFAVGRLELARGDLAGARRDLLRAHALYPTRFEILRALLRLDVREGRLADSAERIQAALVEAPTDARLMQLAGEVALRVGNGPAAEKAFRRAIELDPNDLAAYQNLVSYMLATGRPQEVLHTFQRARDANPNSGVVHLQLGVLYEGRGRIRDAIPRYEEALRLDPSLVVAKNNLAYLLSEQGDDLDRALDLAQDAKAVLPDNPLVSDTLGWVLYKKGVASAAVGYLLEAERGLPDGAAQLGEVRLHLALAHEANDQPAEAREVAARALRDLEAQGAAGADAPPWLAQLQAVADRLDPGQPTDAGNEG